jgi:hypothetical protein
VWVSLWPATAAGQGERVRVSYDVEFSLPGSLLDSNCPSSGTDVLTGTLVGMEPPVPHEPNVYVGMLRRATQISICGSRTTTSGSEVVCGINIAGSGFADVRLTVEADQRGAWLQYLDDRSPWAQWLPPRPAGPATSTVTGTCDPAEMAELQREYDAGETAGSPNGQPIEVLALPPSAYPFTFQARPPESIWSLKVLRRRP